AEVGVRVDAHFDDDVLAVLPLARDAEFLAVLEPGGDLDVDVAVADAEANRPAERRGQERDVSFHFDSFRRRLRLRPRAPASAAPAGGPTEQVLESATSTAAKHAAEDLLGHLRVHLLGAARTVLETAARESRAGCARWYVRPELVVHRLLLRIGEHVVGVLDLLEARLGLLVARVAIRVVLAGGLAISLGNF